jgi:Uma2 family endonuclease
MCTIRIPSKQQFVMVGEPWSAYTHWLKLFDERCHVRITYDQGVLEVVTLTHQHEHRAAFLARLIGAWTEERGLEIKTGKSTAFRRRVLERGLEPDECFWIANEPLVRDKEIIDLRQDPPPDLVIEIEVTRSCVPRMPIYAALQMPEVWRITKGVLSFEVLQAGGTYTPALTSEALPPLKPANLQRFLDMRGKMGENAVIRRFRNWVRKLPPPPLVSVG